MDGKVIIGTDLDTKSFDAQIDYVKSQLLEIEDLLKRADAGEEIGKDTLKLEAQYETLTEKLKKLVAQKEELEKIDFSNVDVQIEGVGKSLTGIVKKVGRWALAVFGVRSAYMAIRSAMNTLTQYDTQLKADIDYMKSALAFALEPVVRKIVEWMKILLTYVGWLVKQWTGKNIFENANKSLKKTVGTAKKLNKQLASFDEMNILQDTKSSGGGGASAPSIDLAKEVNNLEAPEWLQTIKDIGEWILENWEDVVFGLLLTKAFIDLLTGNWFGLIMDIIGILVIGFLELKEAFIGAWEDIVAIWKKWIKPALEKVWQSVKDTANNIWTSIKEIFTKVWNWINDKIFKPIIDKINSIKKQLKDNFKDGFWKGILNTFVDIFNKIIDKINNKLSISISSTLSKVLSAIGVKINAGKYQLFTIPKIPKLAKGGIVNMPSRGVPVGNAIVGERGAEGIIPLTDSQQMALLGEAIGKYITINANITNTMNGRVISKELQRIQNEESFGFNR